MKWAGFQGALTAICFLGDSAFRGVDALTLDTTKPEQVRDVAKEVAAGLVSMYANVNNGKVQSIVSGIPGLLQYPPYYWWEAGAMFGQLIDYWYYTNDTTYNDMVRDGVLFQIGADKNLMPANQSKDEGNDDQLFWAFTVMSAAELNFENPPSDQPGWLELAQSVMNQLISRWDDKTCGGGVRWQIYPWLGGFDYKNTASNGGMFQLGARLALYTGNKTYADWGEKAFNWLVSSSLITKDWQVHDGTDSKKGCVTTDPTQWTYNYGIMIGGAAYMYKYTNGSSVWAERLSGFLKHMPTFFPDSLGGVMVEVCEARQLCNVDQFSFKAYLARWLAIAAQLAPYTAPQILPLLAKSGVAAAKQCNGDGTANRCGSKWNMTVSDGLVGVGQQMSALSVISANLIELARDPFTAATGGTSKGNPSAGTGKNGQALPPTGDPATTADKAGAAILTILVLGATVAGGWWMISSG